MTQDQKETDQSIDERYDVVGMVAGPLYFGLGVNVLAPASLLVICYWVANNYFVENSIPGFADTLFYIFAVLALVQSALALWWRSKAFKAPMIRRRETIEQDLMRGLSAKSKRAFLLIASICLWGFIYFPLTGRFRESALFVVFSFVVFQVVRPRYGFVRKLIRYQEELISQGKFASGPPLMEP